MSSIVPALGERVCLLRQQRRLTQRELADRAGLHATTLSRLERGHQCPPVDGLARLAAALGCSLSHLVDLEGGAATGAGRLALPDDPDILRTRVERALAVLAGEE